MNTLVPPARWAPSEAFVLGVIVLSGGRATRDEIHTQADLSKGGVTLALNRLRRREMVIRRENGLYELIGPIAEAVRNRAAATRGAAE